MTTSDRSPTPAGRPRDPRIDTEVLAVTRAMLLEVGWERLSLRGIAARAGVSRAALARRWPSKAHLVLDSILGSAPDLAPIQGADRRGWIEWVVQGSADLFARPDVRAALPGLVAALRDHEDLRNTLWRNFSGPSAALFSDGSARADLDARAVLVLAAGAAMFASVVAAEDDTSSLRTRILDLLLPAADE
ncbi:helix-turn-helix domain-containing protein [Rhodococcus ruber]|uniref:TetR/AcrR family transcriptional regulator n=1 Tax=Rhodococcus TaxID=1827 RepID=UPI000E6B1E05|nr:MULTISPECIES: TetR/AcrR family transcriptional regulator [Rhodococcus]MDO2381424.1 helix-turn-helix domain-containing protein [Rhodococcus ruber]QDC16879.1 TetR family transcriptional regulator [Rhodococcus ruber]RQM34678.1 TetR family transcriptional regulator [Rhodococcus ruber]UQB72890.1 TetR/AcrR family transcriptional regulator [Rhodococcus ruber]WML62779.1 helix-turn-helix domain-containing protein [Rhodococcus sp. AH-ZY2]